MLLFFIKSYQDSRSPSDESGWLLRLTSTAQSNPSFYEPILSRQQACSTALTTLLDHGFEGAFGRLMLFLVEDQRLNPKQRKELIKILIIKLEIYDEYD